jgi:3D (Asp-Asp-Asp) domain-containing protein
MNMLLWSVTYLFLLSHKQPKPKPIKITAVVTAYCNIPHYSKWKKRSGTCAVDPKYIPYGSYVKFYRNGKLYQLVAIGKHGKRGRVIDVYMTSRHECLKWGRHKLKVEIIKGRHK